MSKVPKSTSTFSKYKSADQMNEKIIIFSHFNAMSDLIQNYLQEKINMNIGVYDGRTSPNDREKIIDDFTNSDDYIAFSSRDSQDQMISGKNDGAVFLFKRVSDTSLSKFFEMEGRVVCLY